MAFKDNILRVYNVYLEHDFVEGSHSPSLLYAYMTHEMMDLDLEKLFRSRRSVFHRREIRDLVRDALKGVQCLHGVGITHGELTMAGMYLRHAGTKSAHSQFTLKLADVGLLTAGSSMWCSGSQPPPLSLAPEQYLGMDIVEKEGGMILGCHKFLLKCLRKIH